MRPAQHSPWFRRAALLSLILLPLACAPGEDDAPVGEDADVQPAGREERGGGRAGGGPRGELAAAVAERTGQSQEEAAAAVDALFEEMSERLAAGEDVRTGDFGAFSVAHRPARTGENPETGEAVEIPERATVRFRPGKKLRDAVADAPVVEEPPKPAARGDRAKGADADEGAEDDEAEADTGR